MSAPIATHKKADAISLGVMLIGIGIISYIPAWWPGILLVIGASTLVRQYLRGRHYDMAISAIVFGGLFLYFYYDINWAVTMPVLFIVGGIYLIFREYFVTKERVGDDIVEDETQEIDDESRSEK